MCLYFIHSSRQSACKGEGFCLQILGYSHIINLKLWTRVGRKHLAQLGLSILHLFENDEPMVLVSKPSAWCGDTRMFRLSMALTSWGFQCSDGGQ